MAAPTAQGPEKRSHVRTHPAALQQGASSGGCMARLQEVQGTYVLRYWIVLACREAWPNEGDLPGHAGPQESTEKSNKFLGSWERDGPPAPWSLKALIGPCHGRKESQLRSAPSPGYGLLTGTLSPLVQQTFRCCGRDPGPRRSSKGHPQSTGKGLENGTWKHMDLTSLLRGPPAEERSACGKP